MEQVLAGGMVERCFIPHIDGGGFGGMALWRLGVRCTEMDSHRRRLLSGVMVTSMAEWPDKVEASI